MGNWIVVVLFISGFLVSNAQQNINSLDQTTAIIKELLDKKPVLYTRVFLNQKKYSPGDTVFFKAYFMGTDNAPAKGKALLHFALLDHTGKTLQQIDFLVRDGIGFSQLTLPDSLPAGKYRVIAFNDWMRNFNPSVFCEEDIFVVKDKELIPAEGPSEIQFFAEGGSLIQSVPNEVKIQSNQKNQNLLIMDAQSHELTQVLLDETGFGHFVITPQDGGAYFAKVQGAETRYPLPSVKKDGISVLHGINANQDDLKIQLYIPKNSDLRNKEIFIFLIVGQGIYYSATSTLNDKDVVSLSIPKKTLPNTLAQLLITDSKRNFLVQRSFMVSGPNQQQATLTIAPNELKQRDRVVLNISLKDVNQKPVPGEFSISVTNQQVIQMKGDPGPIDVSKNIFTSLYNFTDEQGVNDRLIGWPGFYPWEKILKAKTTPTPEFPLRTRVYKKGKAFFQTSGDPVPDSTVVTVYLQKSLGGYETVVGANGEFDMVFLFDFYEADEMFYVAKHRGKFLDDVAIRFHDNHISGAPFRPWKEGNRPDEYAAAVLKIKQVNSSYNFFTSSTENLTQGAINLNEKFEDEFMGADVSVNVDDYVILPTMEDLIREVVPSLGIRRLKNGIAVRVIFSVSSIVSTDDPLYIIDGVMTRRSDLFLSLNPKDVLTIKVENDLNKLSRLGVFGETGIVYVQTKKQNTAEQIRAMNTTVPIPGLSKPVVTHWPSYDSKINWHKPDFRFTEYWNPSIKTDAQGTANVSFFLSDIVGTINVRIEGFLTNGQHVSVEQDMKVTFAPTTKN